MRKITPKSDKDGFKYCNVCNIEKPFLYFHKDSNSPDGCSKKCKECQVLISQEYYIANKDRIKARVRAYNREHFEEMSERYRDYHLHRKYGIDSLIYDVMLKKQNRKCAICEKSIDELDHALAVDHNHLTGKVRGLLCPKCNLSVGVVEDVEFKNKIEDYLYKYSI